MTDNLNKNNVDDAFAKIFLGEVNIAENKQNEIKSQPIETEELKKVEVKDEQEQEDIQEEPKTTEKSEEQQKDLLKADLKVEYESLKKQLNDAKSWGHKKNAAYINAKKKITDFLSKLQEDSLINEDEAGLALKAFDEAAISEEELQSNDKGNSYAQLKANLDKEFNIFKKYNKEQNKIAAAVISPEFTELERIKEHYEMSVNVIRLLYKLHISGVRKAEEWLPFSLLMHCRNTSEYNFIKMTVLDKLQEYDRRYQSSLLDTLSAALRENSLEDAAERQHIHINTLRYRLGKIKEITQKNYFKMTDRYFLLLCIMIQRMEHEQL